MASPPASDTRELLLSDSARDDSPPCGQQPLPACQPAHPSHATRTSALPPLSHTCSDEQQQPLDDQQRPQHQSPPSSPYPVPAPAVSLPSSVPSHLRHRYRALHLPPYPKYASVRAQFLALSRINQAFLVVVVLLWPLAFLAASTRLVALFLPLLFVPTFVLYYVYARYYPQHCEINVLVHTYATAFTVAALIVLVLESLLTVLFASLTLYWQMDELAAWLLEQGGSGGSGGSDSGESSDPFGFLSKTAGFFVFVFLVAFLVAGCVEESMKYALTVRIKRITPGFADRHGFLLYALTAALGFSTLENVGYAFQVRTPALAVLVNVASRALVSTPLHLCCGYLVGVGVVRRDVYGERLPLWRLMALPVALHGGLDSGLVVAQALIRDETLLRNVEVVLVALAFFLFGLAIRCENRHIAGPPPVLPTAVAAVAVDKACTRLSVQIQQLSIEEQPSVVKAVQDETSGPYRLEHVGDARV